MDDVKIMLSPDAVAVLEYMPERASYPIPANLTFSIMCYLKKEDNSFFHRHDENRFSYQFRGSLNTSNLMDDGSIFYRVYEDPETGIFYVHGIHYIENQRCAQTGMLATPLLCNNFKEEHLDQYVCLKKVSRQRRYKLSCPRSDDYFYCKVNPAIHALIREQVVVVQAHIIRAFNRVDSTGLFSINPAAIDWITDNQFCLHFPNDQGLTALKDGICLRGFYSEETPNKYYIDSVHLMENGACVFSGKIEAELKSGARLCDTDLSTYETFFLSDWKKNPLLAKPLEAFRKNEGREFFEGFVPSLASFSAVPLKQNLLAARHTVTLDQCTPRLKKVHVKEVGHIYLNGAVPKRATSNYLGDFITKLSLSSRSVLVNFIDLSDPLSRIHRQFMDVVMEEFKPIGSSLIDVVIRDAHGVKTRHYNDFLQYAQQSHLPHTTPHAFSIVFGESSIRLLDIDVFAEHRDAKSIDELSEQEYQSGMKKAILSLRALSMHLDQDSDCHMLDLGHVSDTAIHDAINDHSKTSVIVTVTTEAQSAAHKLAESAIWEAKKHGYSNVSLFLLPQEKEVSSTVVEVFNTAEKTHFYRFERCNLKKMLFLAKKEITLAIMASYEQHPMLSLLPHKQVMSDEALFDSLAFSDQKAWGEAKKDLPHYFQCDGKPFTAEIQGVGNRHSPESTKKFNYQNCDALSQWFDELTPVNASDIEYPHFHCVTTEIILKDMNALPSVWVNRLTEIINTITQKGIAGLKADRVHWASADQFVITIDGIQRNAASFDRIVLRGFYNADTPNSYTIHAMDKLQKSRCVETENLLNIDQLFDPSAIVSQSYKVLSLKSAGSNVISLNDKQGNKEITDYKDAENLQQVSIEQRLLTQQHIQHLHKRIQYPLLTRAACKYHLELRNLPDNLRGEDALYKAIDHHLKSGRFQRTLTFVNILDLSDGKSLVQHAYVMNMIEHWRSVFEKLDYICIDVIARDEHGEKTDFYDCINSGMAGTPFSLSPNNGTMFAPSTQVFALPFGVNAILSGFKNKAATLEDARLYDFGLFIDSDQITCEENKPDEFYRRSAYWVFRHLELIVKHLSRDYYGEGYNGVHLSAPEIDVDIPELSEKSVLVLIAGDCEQDAYKLASSAIINAYYCGYQNVIHFNVPEAYWDDDTVIEVLNHETKAEYYRFTKADLSTPESTQDKLLLTIMAMYEKHPVLSALFKSHHQNIQDTDITDETNKTLLSSIDKHRVVKERAPKNEPPIECYIWKAIQKSEREEHAKA